MLQFAFWFCCHFMGNKIRFFFKCNLSEENINLEIIIIVLNTNVILQLIKSHELPYVLHARVSKNWGNKKMRIKFLKPSDICILKLLSFQQIYITTSLE